MEARTASAELGLHVRFRGNCLSQFFHLQQQQEEVIFRVFIQPSSWPTPSYPKRHWNWSTLLVALTRQYAAWCDRTRVKDRILFLPPSTLTPIHSWGMETDYPVPKIPSHPPSPPRGKLIWNRPEKNKEQNYVKHMLIKYLARKTELNIQVLSPCCEEDSHLLIFS